MKTAIPPACPGSPPGRGSRPVALGRPARRGSSARPRDPCSQRAARIGAEASSAPRGSRHRFLVSQASVSAPRETATPISAASSAAPGQTAGQATLAPSITLPPPSATTRSAPVAAQQGRQCQHVLDRRMRGHGPVLRHQLGAECLAGGRGDLAFAGDRVVASSNRVQSATSGGSASATGAAATLLCRPAMMSCFSFGCRSRVLHAPAPRKGSPGR